MDVDGDVDGTLAQAFGCMGTNDREVLIRQFQQLLGENHQVSAESCAFFLDMNNWNLQAALGSYYDYGSTNGLTGLPPPEYASRLPSMQFVQDVTIGEQWQHHQSSHPAPVYGGGGGSGFAAPSAPVFIQRPATDMPDVPPCTPCTPPDRSDRMQS
uniref:Uncharacterized protein n=1 Tax=Plectus sambesii TaxID=2011161 RepID=A0A914UNI3_9BILA